MKIKGVSILVRILIGILIGALLGTTEAGIYVVASRMSYVASFGLTACNQIAAPMIAELYAANGGQERFVADFVDAWSKVMMLDRFDVDASEGTTAVASR